MLIYLHQCVVAHLLIPQKSSPLELTSRLWEAWACHVEFVQWLWLFGLERHARPQHLTSVLGTSPVYHWQGWPQIETQSFKAQQSTYNGLAKCALASLIEDWTHLAKSQHWFSLACRSWQCTLNHCSTPFLSKSLSDHIVFYTHLIPRRVAVPPQVIQEPFSLLQ